MIPASISSCCLFCLLISRLKSVSCSTGKRHTPALSSNSLIETGTRHPRMVLQIINLPRNNTLRLFCTKEWKKKAVSSACEVNNLKLMSPGLREVGHYSLSAGVKSKFSMIQHWWDFTKSPESWWGAKKLLTCHIQKPRNCEQPGVFLDRWWVNTVCRRCLFLTTVMAKTQCTVRKKPMEK